MTDQKKWLVRVDEEVNGEEFWQSFDREFYNGRWHIDSEWYELQEFREDPTNPPALVSDSVKEWLESLDGYEPDHPVYFEEASE